MTFTTNSATAQAQEKLEQNVPPPKRREGHGGRGNFRKRKCPQNLLVCSIVPILAFLCWLPDFIVALKDVSVTIPQAVKRGSNAMLTCNYDMENDTLYSVKWYKGRREFYRYTPKENPAMKVFPSQSGLNVERNLSNQSHVVLLAVPLNISGKFTCEISVEAPSFQTAMVSGEMEVVELPEEQATVTGIQPRYRIGDLVDGNCSIKYSKPAANLTWTINGIVVPPHHIKTYQVEKYEESNLESVMSAIHFMVTTQHFIKGQMRLKCAASIFDIFKEEIESVIEEDRPRIMASGQSYPPDHGYGTHAQGDGYEHNESYLTYFSAPKSSASSAADCLVGKIVRFLKQNLLKNFQPLRSLIEARAQFALTTTFVNHAERSWVPSVGTGYFYILPLIPFRCITTAFLVLFVVVLLQLKQQQLATKSPLVKLAHGKQMVYNFIDILKEMTEMNKEYFLTKNFWRKIECRNEKEQPKASENRYQVANDDDCQTECGQRQQYQPQKYFLVANQNVVNENVVYNDTNVINTINKNENSTTIAGITTAIDCQHRMSQTLALATLPPTFCSVIHFPQASFPSCSSTTTPTASASASASSSLSLPNGRTYAHDSFPLDAVDASKSNNAKYMSKDQTLLMTFNATAATSIIAGAAPATSKSLCGRQSIFAPVTETSVRALVLESELLQTSVHSPLEMVELHSLPSPLFFRNNYLMAFIGELLLRHC